MRRLCAKSIRAECHHIFGIGDVYLECAVDGARDVAELARKPLAVSTFPASHYLNCLIVYTS